MEQVTKTEVRGFDPTYGGFPRIVEVVVSTDGDFRQCEVPFLRVMAYVIAWELGLSVQTCRDVGLGITRPMFIFALVCVDRHAHIERCIA